MGGENMSKTWSVVETKAKLSEVLKRAALEPQVIESRGEPVAVVLSFEEYMALKARSGEAGGKTESPMGRFLRASEALRRETGGVDLELPPRTDRANPLIDDETP